MKYQNIYDEYIETLKQYNDIYNKIENLPKGYLTSRTINNKKYYYLQQTVNGKKKSKCLHADEIESTKKSIEQRPKAIKFAKAMTSLEGLPISFDLNSKLNLWIDGKILFSDIYFPTLKNYGVLKNA